MSVALCHGSLTYLTLFCQIEEERTAVETLIAMCNVSDADARAILLAFNWDCNEACSAYLEDEAAVRLKAGILDLANGPVVHDTEGTVWRSLWMYESGSSLQPYCWNDQWQIDEAYRKDPKGTTRIKNEQQLGQRSSYHPPATRVVDLSRMVEVTGVTGSGAILGLTLHWWHSEYRRWWALGPHLLSCS